LVSLAKYDRLIAIRNQVQAITGRDCNAASNSSHQKYSCTPASSMASSAKTAIAVRISGNQARRSAKDSEVRELSGLLRLTILTKARYTLISLIST